MAGQRRIARMDLAVATDQQLQRHGFRVVPPDLAWDAAEILEPLNHPFQNGFHTLGRQRDRKRTVRVRPHQNQNRNRTTPLGEIDVDLPEVGLQPLARIMRQRNERFPLTLPALPDIAPHGVVAALIPLASQTPEDLHHRMTLLRRRLLVRGEDLVDPLQIPGQRAVMLPLPWGIPLRLAVAAQNLTDLPPRMMKPPGDLADTHPIAMRPTNPSVMIHRKHPILRKPSRPLLEEWFTEFASVGPDSTPIFPRPRSVLDAYLHAAEDVAAGAERTGLATGMGV